MTAIWEGAFASMDPLTMNTIVQLQLEDSQELVDRKRGKARQDTPMTDAQFALDLYMEDLRTCESTLQDRKMAQSIAFAVIQDGQLIQQEYAKQDQIVRDAELAASLATARDDTMPALGVNRPVKKQKLDDDPWKDPEMLDKVAAIYMQQPHDAQDAFQEDDGYDSDGKTIAESSATAAARNPNAKPACRTCIACGDRKQFFEVARVPCNHEYCQPCLEQLFRLSLTDETLFPPRCDGQEIPLNLVRFFLPRDLAKDFDDKYPELSTKNRTYCFERTCQAFIPTSSIEGDVATCTKCSRTTCALCKAPSHSGDCPADTAMQQLVATANSEQWQRCYQCNRFIELGIGCNHMTQVPSFWMQTLSLTHS